MNRDTIQRKISLIQDELVHLESIAHLSFDEIAADFAKQAMVERVLERVINRAIDINRMLIAERAKPESAAPKGYRDSFLALAELGVYPSEFAEDISRSVGTRNKLVHEYDSVDQNQIYSSIKDCLSPFLNLKTASIITSLPLFSLKILER